MSSLDTDDDSQLFLRDKQAWENAIAAYEGNDPLELWYNYISWFDYNIHVDPENKFRESLEKCLAIFEHNECYKQDIRMIKLWVKYIDLQPNPLKLYQILYQRGIGTQCASFYIGWAHYYDSASAFREAESVYNLGFQARAEPYSELQDSHTKFRLSVSHRMLYNDSSSKKRSATHLSEQRQQITTLNPSTKKKCSEISDSSSEEQSMSPQNTHFAQQTHNSQQVNYTQATNQTSNHTQTHKIQSPNQNHANNYVNSLNYSTNQSHTSNSPNSNEEQFLNCQSHTNNMQNFSYASSNSNNQQISSNFQASNSIQFANKPISNYAHSSGSSNRLNTPNTTQILNKCINKHNYETHIHNSNRNQHSNYNELNYDEGSQNEDTAKNPSTANPYNIGEQCNLKNSANVISSSLNSIYGDTNSNSNVENLLEDEYPLQNVKLPSNFARYCKNNYEVWTAALIVEEPYDSYRKSVYQKNLVYPGDGCEYSPEEIRSRRWIKKLDELKARKPKDSSKGHKMKAVQNTLVENRSEEQIEASTIRFSTDTGGLTKNKSITIKFRREKPTGQKNCDSSKMTSNYSYTIDNGHNFDYDDNPKKFDQNSDNYDLYSDDTVQRHTSKIKKIKRIKLLNNYDDPKYLSNINRKSSSDYCNQEYKHKRSATISRNEYEDANLLLSFANVSSDANAYSSYSTTQNTDVTCNEDSVSNNDCNSSFNDIGYYGGSNCSTPVRKLSQSYSKSSTPQYNRILNRHTSNVSLQNEDSICSYEQNSFFAAEHDEDFRSTRLEKAQHTIETLLAKPIIDPFSTELCKAFLTKLDFPSREENNVYKVVNTPIPKLANTKVATFANITYSIEKEVGRGSYGSVYKAVNNSTGAIVALKFQKPPNIWELYVCTEVRKRIRNYDILPGLMDISSAIVAPNASILVTEFSVYGSLLDINNKIRQATKKVMHESLVMHFSSQILNIVSHLHSCKIIHGDIKPDNFLLMRVPNSDSHIPSLRLIDFGCAIDMRLFPEKTEFKKVIQTDGFTCIEMQEGRPWSYQTDLFCIAGTVHVMLFGEYMQLVKKYDMWDIKQKLPRYLKKLVWTEFYTKMLNIKDVNSLPDILEMKNILDDEVRKMDSELQTQIRTLSNLLHRR